MRDHCNCKKYEYDGFCDHPEDTTVSESPSVTGYGALLELAENWEKSARKDTETYGHDGNEWYNGRSVTYTSCAEALRLLMKEMVS